MRQARVMSVIAVVSLVLSAAIASSAPANAQLLTFYANGEAIPNEAIYSDTFELVTTSPVSISIPETGLSISCPAEPMFMSLGWFASNGLSNDTIETNGFYAGPVRECAGHSFEGLLLLGTIHLESSGAVRMGWSTLMRDSPQLGLDGCSFSGELKGRMKLPGPLKVTLKGTMKSHQARCPLVANIEVGALEGLRNSSPVEGRLSP